MRVIFLDIDGVLNSKRFFDQPPVDSNGAVSFGAGQIDPQAVTLLDHLIDEADAHVVISSSWRHIWNWHEITRMLKERGFKNSKRIVGQTPASRTDNRGDEVREWLGLDRERRVVQPELVPVSAWVILDDTNEFHTEQLPHFVQTNPDRGLTPSDVRRALSILARGL